MPAIARFRCSGRYCCWCSAVPSSHPHGVAASASPRMVFIGGPAYSAPVLVGTWFGTTTATATLGSLAGAKAIIQSFVSGWPKAPTVSAVPVLAATFHDDG